MARAYSPAVAVSASIGSKVVRFAANVDPSESDLAVVDERTFAEGLGRPVHVASDADAVADGQVAGRTGELAAPVLYLVIALLLGEMCMALWFGSLRTAG